MKLEVHKNKYGYDYVNCPHCSKEVYVRVSSKTSPDALRNLKRHITNSAKDEALAVALDDKIPTPHLTYYKEHTSDEKVVVKPAKRAYDSDLSI